MQLGKKNPCTLDSLQHNSPQKKKKKSVSRFPQIALCSAEFLSSSEEMWSSLDLDFYSIFTLLPDELCGVWTSRILYYFMR